MPDILEFYPFRFVGHPAYSVLHMKIGFDRGRLIESLSSGPS